MILRKATAYLHTRVRFDRNELAGAFGGIGSDLPLILSLVLVANLEPASVFTMFGLMNISIGLTYGIPVAVQIHKLAAVLVITQGLSSSVLYGSALATGIAMLLLTAVGLIDKIAQFVPLNVIRGIQLGVGFQLANLALGNYVQSEATFGYILAGIAFVIVVALFGNRKYPPVFLVIILGLAYSILFKVDANNLITNIGINLPHFHSLNLSDVWLGFILLSLPQIPLSIGNSILATNQTAKDFFPEAHISVRKVSLTYAVMNLINPFFGGIPTSHASNGMAGYYAFGGRTGGTVVLYGMFYLILGVFFSGSVKEIILLFPRPILGIILLFEALMMMLLIQDIASDKSRLVVALLVALTAVSLPYGYVFGLVLGSILDALIRKQYIGLGKQLVH